jgi:hypothetical protein
MASLSLGGEIHARTTCEGPPRKRAHLGIRNTRGSVAIRPPWGDVCARFSSLWKSRCGDCLSKDEI